tara:strand:- start:662 stop:1246 length:585 start_codon:yes stop_codon:yes gene_type:complete
MITGDRSVKVKKKEKTEVYSSVPKKKEKQIKIPLSIDSLKNLILKNDGDESSDLIESDDGYNPYGRTVSEDQIIKKNQDTPKMCKTTSTTDLINKEFQDKINQVKKMLEKNIRANKKRKERKLVYEVYACGHNYRILCPNKSSEEVKELAKNYFNRKRKRIDNETNEQRKILFKKKNLNYFGSIFYPNSECFKY